MKRSIWTYCNGIIRRCHWLIAGLLLALMLGLIIGSMSQRSAIVDEVAHIPAAYSYLHYGDYRLNPEHPPLMKVLAGIPLQFMHLKFPANSTDWTTEVNGEWDVGYDFLYNLGNNASQIIFWARLPLAIFTVLGGAFIWWFTRWRYGWAIALLTVFFYALSPNFIGNGGLVTTDVGAAIFIFVALAAFVAFSRWRSWRWTIILSFAIAGAELAKFNGLVLYPFLALLVVVLAVLESKYGHEKVAPKTFVWRFFVACALSMLWVYLFYVPFMWNLSVQAQQQLINGSLANQPLITGPLTWLAGLPGGQPLAQFFLGAVMDTGRIEGGNVTYFFGHATNGSFVAYFPILFLVKTQVSFLLLLAASSIAAIAVAWRQRSKRSWRAINTWLHGHWLEATLGSFVILYLLLAMGGNLDIGLRHILPIYPPLFVLVAGGTIWIWRRIIARWRWKVVAGVLLGGLLAWYAIAALWIYPNYLTYFNEFIGGPGNAYKYFTDSSVDWGQSLIQFQQYLNDHPQIHTVALDYFGGGYQAYYFCNREYNAAGQLLTGPSDYDCSHSRVIDWHSQNGPYHGQYIAVSETYLENDRYYAPLIGQSGYAYLRAKQPIAKIGDSIYLYKLY